MTSTNQLTTFGDGRDINEDNEEIPEWARPYIRTLKQQVTYLLTTADAEALAAAFQRGVEAVTAIRCAEHVAVPQYNTNGGSGGECGACVAREVERHDKRTHGDGN